MSMQQPVPPEQGQAQPVADMSVQPSEAQAPVTEQPSADVAQAPVTEQPLTQEQQVIDAVAQGLVDEEITAADIMTAVLSDSLGISPAGAQSLFQLLMSELVDDVNETEGDTVPTDVVPPTTEG